MNNKFEGCLHIVRIAYTESEKLEKNFTKYFYASTSNALINKAKKWCVKNGYDIHNSKKILSISVKKIKYDNIYYEIQEVISLN